MYNVLNTVRAISVLLLSAVLSSSLAGGLAGPALAQVSDEGASSPMSARLSAEKVGDVETGIYSAGDKLSFTLQSYGDKYLLRFPDSPESYVLNVERIILGGRILRYDTGVIAIRVSVWGGMTLYTADAPNGLPATKVSNTAELPPLAVSHDDLVAAMRDEESHFAYTQQLRLRFAADQGVLAGSDDTRRLAFDALISAEAEIEKLIAAPGGRQALIRRFDTVRLSQGDKPVVTVQGKTLVVDFAPAAGPAGRASSRAVALQLGKMLQIAEAG